MLSTESFVGARALGEESLQMWDLNKRLEAYLARVKFLEEENEVLRAEIQSAKSGPAGDSWRVKYEEELRALRDALGQAFREKCTAELARDNLYEEVQQVKSRCQKEQAAREEAKKLLALSKKELEEERRAQIWLKERAVQLEKEVESLLEVHEEEKAGLDQEIASFSQSLESFRCAPVAFQPVEVEDYSKRLSEIWKGAVETYKTEVSQLEGSLCQAKENLWKAVEDNQQSQLRLQHLEKDLAGLKVRKEMLEESLARQWQEQRGEAEKFQLAMEALEQEKQTLRVQIAQVLEDRQQLMHLKMSLSLEVATYRTLLEAESTRLQMPPSEYKLAASGLRDLKLEASASTEARRLPPRAHRASPSVFSRARAQSDAPSPKSQSSSTRELQKINSGLQKINLGLHAAAPQAAGAIQEVVVPGRPTPSTSWPSKAAPSLSLEPPSPVPPEPGSPGGEGPAWPGGEEDEVIREMENPPLGAATETRDAKTELLGEAPTRSLRYPAQLVSEALEDALKEMKDDAQPKEEPILSATWAPQDAPSPIPPTEVCRRTWEGEDPSEDARGGEALEAEKEVGEVEFQGLGTESSTRWDGAASPLGSHPCGTATSQSATVSQEEMEAWEEETPAALSPREAEAASQEEDTGSSGQVETGWEEPEEGDNEADAPSVEGLHPSEEEEEDRGSHSPRGEDGDFQGEGMDARDREAQAAGAVPVESHPVLLTESHLEEDLVDGEEEKFEHQEMCETELAADEETGQEMCPEQETCPEQEPFSTHEAIPAEDASSEAEEDAVGEEEPGRAGEKVEASGEVLGGEDTWAGESSGPEIPGPEDWEVTAEDTEEPLGTEEPAWAGDTLTSAGGLEREGRDVALPSELEATWEDDEDAGNQGMRQQQPPLEAEPAPGLARGEQEIAVDAPGQGDKQEPAEALEEPWETRDEDDELSSELGQLESSSTGPTALQPVPGESAEEDAERWGELEKAPGRSVELEDTLPDSTSFHLYDGETLDGVAPNQNPSETEENMETTPESEIALEETEESMEAAPKSEIDLEEAEETTEAAPESKTALEEAEETTETHPEYQTALEEDEENTEAVPEPKTALEEAEENTETHPEHKTALEEDEENTEAAPEPKTALEEAEETMQAAPESKTALEEAEETTEAAPEPKTALEDAEETMETAPESKTALEEAEETMETAPESKTALEEAEETMETAPESKISPEDEGWLDESDKPPTPTMPESHEEEVGTTVAPAAEGAEEEEGYFMVSAPIQEMSTLEEAEISEDFEEIQVEETRASKDNLEAPEEASPVPEDEGHFEAFVGEADEDMKMLTEEPDMPKGEDEDDAEDFCAELEEGPAATEADPGSPGATGPLEGDADEPAQVAAGSDECEGPEYSEGLATELVEELGDVVELENDAGGAETLTGHNLELVGQEEEEEKEEKEEEEKKEEEEEDEDEEEMEEDEPSVTHPNVAEPNPPAELQVMPVSPLPDQAEQPSDEQPHVEEEAPDGHSPSLAGDEEPPEADPTQTSFPEVVKDNPEVSGDIMKDSDILEIVEQALEFNQELVMGARVAEEEQRRLSGTELPQDTGEDSSPASSSEEEPTVQEAPVDAAPGMESPARAENGLHREASLEDLSEFTEEALNGIAAVPPAQEFPAETGEPMPPQPPSPGDATTTTTTTKLVDATSRGKSGGADIVPTLSPLGDDVLCLAPDQPPACRLRAEEEPWSSGDE